MSLKSLATLALATLLVAPSLRAQTIWVEGESPQSNTMNRHPWWYDKVDAGELSGGAWISNYSEDKAGAATYTVNIPKAGKYFFWVRANPVGTNLTYKLNDEQEKPVPIKDAIDSKNIAEGQALDHRFIAWIKLGEVELAAGKQTVTFTIGGEGAVNNSGAIDCFFFSTDNVQPLGKARPGAAPAVTETDKNSWAFNPPEDMFKADALLDLRSLNEPVAGETGFIKLSPDGNSFLRGDGQPIRFWAVVSGGWELAPDQMETHARWLAKLGVNMVRVHANISMNDDGADINAVNDKAIDGIQRWVSVCKKNGIYVTISPYWAHARCPESWGIDGYKGEQPWGVMFFNPKLQAAYKTWARELYTRPNPHLNGVPLKDEPAVAIAQVKNEDSLLFWTFQNIKPEQQKLLGQQFYTWAVAKYGSVEKVQQAWDNTTHDNDSLDAKVFGFHLIWELTQPQAGGKAIRLADMTEFLTYTQHKFYASMQKFYKEELQIKQPTNAMNWRSADQVLLDDAERYTYSAMDVSAVNYYTGGLHAGENNGYRIDPGHHFTNESVLRGMTFPGAIKQTAGHPMMITETAWVNPNLYQTEGPFLMAAYQSLSGVDITYWFAHGGKTTWETDPRAMFWPVGSSHATFKWFGNFYGQAGQFPAYALAYRLGYIQQAKEPAVYEERSLDDINQRRVPIISESGRFDPNRDAGTFAPASPIRQEISRDAFFVGPVVAKYAGDPKNSKAVNLSKYINASTGDIKSLTGELLLNKKLGFATINTPKIQGVTGFLKSAGETFELADVRIRSSSDYATIAVVSLDQLPIRSSKKLLVQVGTTSRLGGFESKPVKREIDGKTLDVEEVVSNGVPPWRVVNTSASVTINNPSITKATLLDTNGYASKPVPLNRAGDKLTLALPSNALWVVLE
jgi:hypothetical protein